MRTPAQPSSRTTARRWSAALAGVAVAAVVLSPVSPSAPAGASAAGPSADLVSNGSFEAGTSGWRTNRKRQLFTTSRPATDGASSARLRMAVPGRTVLRTLEPTVTEADPTATYTLSAYVRSTGRPIDGKLRAREIRNGAVVERHAVDFRAGSAWKRVRLTFSPRTNGALDVSVAGERLNTHVALLVDDLTLTSVGGSGSPDPETPDPGTPDPGTPGPCVSDPMGIPEPGQTYLGAAVGGTSDLGTRESDFGMSLPLHRTYYQGDQIARAVRVASEDLAEGRLPWISFKPPLTWAEMAAGDGNAWGRELADALATVPGPVWFALHHEPETDGDMALWTEMQRQIAPIIHERTDNVAYSVIYSSWHTYSRGQDTVATKWPGDQNVDILAVDAYNPYGAIRDGKMVTATLDIKSYYQKMAAWTAAHGTRAWAIGETGQTPTGADVDPTWMARAYHDMKALGGAGLNWFDSSRNSDADWTLDYQVKFDSYDRLLPESVRVC